MSRLFILLLLHISGSLAIFHRWYIPQKNTLSVDKHADKLYFWRSFQKYQKRSDLPTTVDGGRFLQDCVTVSHGEDKSFMYTYNPDHGGVCGLYLIGRPDEKIVVTLEKIDLSGDCSRDMLVLVDGWELNGNVLPSIEDHDLSLRDRLVEVCSDEKEGISLFSSQNSAMVQFKITSPNSKFKITVKYIKHLDPCNILMSEMTGTFKISNNGRERNCSVTTLLFPAKISLLEVKIGSKEQAFSSDKRTSLGNIPQECDLRDYLELGGSGGLNAGDLETKSMLCGHNPQPAQKDVTILCESSTIRLVSSGDFRNTVTAVVREATEDDLDLDENIVMKCQDS